MAATRLATLCIPFVQCNPVKEAASSAAGGVLDLFASWLSDGAAWMVGKVMSLLGQVASVTSAVNLDGRWFKDKQGLMLRVSGALLVPLLMAATLGAVLRQDARRLFRTWCVALPAAVLVGIFSIALTEMAMSVTDELTSLVAGSERSDVYGDFAHVAMASAIPGAPQLIGVLVSLLFMAGALLLWLELVVRAAAIYIAVFFLPLTLAGLVWPATTAMAKRLVELLAVLILSKFVIVSTLTLGAAAVTNGDPASKAFTGGAILLLAAFAPFTLLKLVPVVEAAAIAHLEGVARRPLRAGAHTVSSAAAAPSHPVVAAAMAARDGGTRAGVQSSAVVAQSVEERHGSYPADEGSAATADAGSGPAAGPPGAPPPHPGTPPGGEAGEATGGVSAPVGATAEAGTGRESGGNPASVLAGLGASVESGVGRGNGGGADRAGPPILAGGEGGGGDG